MTTATPISVAILAGGQSRRFGSDKALARVPGAAETILGRTVRIANTLSEDVLIVAPPDRPYGKFGVPIVGEQPSGEGPLGGLIAALTNAAHPRCLVLACDLPFLELDLLSWLVTLPFRGQALVPRVGVDRQAQTLVAIYSRTCLDTAVAIFGSGERRMQRLIEAIDTDYVDEDELRMHDPTLNSFVNFNTPPSAFDGRSDVGR